MSTPSSAGEDARAAAVKRLVSDLEHNLRDAVQRSMRFKLDGSVGIGLLAADLGSDEAQVAMGYTHLGETLGLDWAKGAAF